MLTYDLNLESLGVNNDVLWFEISMTNVYRVQVLYSLQYLLHNGCALFFPQKISFSNKVKELKSIYVLHDYVELRGIFEHFIDFNNIWVVCFL